MQNAVDEGSSAGLVTARALKSGSSASTPIDSSNIGFQGRLEPIQAFVKKNKRGLGAEKTKAIKQSKDNNNKEDQEFPKFKVKGISKRMRKIQEVEMKMQEKEFDRDFFRMFWPDKV